MKNPKTLTLSPDISLSGNYKKLQKAKQKLTPVLNIINTLDEKAARIAIQDAIDEFQISTSVMYRGHLVWSRRKIMQNLDQIIAQKQLYTSKKKVKWMRMNKDIYLPLVPKDFKPILSDYFYEFLTIVCGSRPHYNKAGWIGLYPTLEDLKRFFQKNEYGKAVSEYVPAWKTDAHRIIRDIELKLFPFKSYIKASKREP